MTMGDSITRGRTTGTRIVSRYGKMEELSPEDSGSPIQRLPDSEEKRLHALALKHSAGTLTREERLDFEALTKSAQQLMVKNARALSRSAGPESYAAALRDERRAVHKSKSRSHRRPSA
jgi:hypothetical protein